MANDNTTEGRSETRLYIGNTTDGRSETRLYIDNTTEGRSETRLYIGHLYVYFNMSKLIKYIFYNVGRTLEITVSKVALFSLQSMLASEISELLFPEVQNPTVCIYVISDHFVSY
jgi:hypothetical protein